MKVHQLEVGAHPDRKRVGRGISSGYGKTSGRGTKGQNSRSGGGVRLGFEGGQNPWAKRMPKKRGFKAINHISYQVVNLDDLARVKGTTVSADSLYQAGLIGSTTKPVKILGDGEVSAKLTVKVTAVSKVARKQLEAAGGTIELVTQKATVKE